jgi:hypothetical protein
MNLIPNAHEFVHYKKYVSIHSEDRDITKYPSSSEFDIEMPEEILSVSEIRLSTWTFPSNYNAINASNSRITFRINAPYNPGEHSYSSLLDEKIFEVLFYSIDADFIVDVEEGFYNPEQMARELTNKFNEVVTYLIKAYFTANAITVDFTLYDRFKIVYHAVNQKLWFGNSADGFVITNESILDPCKQQYVCQNVVRSNAINGVRSEAKGTIVKEYVNWGLPYNLGFERMNAPSIAAATNSVPRFYYDEQDDGYWLVPSLPGAQVHFIKAPQKINLMGQSFFYMELEGLNCIDETSPDNLTKFTKTSNETNGRVNSAFAKIAVPSTPISQWFDYDSAPYKLFMPPADRIRKLRVKLRYHNGQLVDFGTFDYTFTLEFLIHQNRVNIIRKY